MDALDFMHLHQAAQEREGNRKVLTPSPHRNDLLVLVDEVSSQDDVRRYFRELSVWQLEALLRYEGISFPVPTKLTARDEISPERREELQALSLSD